MAMVEVNIDEEALEMINELAQEMGVSRGEVVRMLISFALAHTDEVFEDEEAVENLEDENGDSEED